MPTIYKKMEPQPKIEWSQLGEKSVFIFSVVCKDNPLFLRVEPPYKPGDEIECDVCGGCGWEYGNTQEPTQVKCSNQCNSGTLTVTSCAPELRDGVWNWRIDCE